MVEEVLRNQLDDYDYQGDGCARYDYDYDHVASDDDDCCCWCKEMKARSPILCLLCPFTLSGSPTYIQSRNLISPHLQDDQSLPGIRETPSPS